MPARTRLRTTLPTAILAVSICPRASPQMHMARRIVGSWSMIDFDGSGVGAAIGSSILIYRSNVALPHGPADRQPSYNRSQHQVRAVQRPIQGLIVAGQIVGEVNHEGAQDDQQDNGYNHIEFVLKKIRCAAHLVSTM